MDDTVFAVLVYQSSNLSLVLPMWRFEPDFAAEACFFALEDEGHALLNNIDKRESRVWHPRLASHQVLLVAEVVANLLEGSVLRDVFHADYEVCCAESQLQVAGCQVDGLDVETFLLADNSRQVTLQARTAPVNLPFGHVETLCQAIEEAVGLFPERDVLLDFLPVLFYLVFETLNSN